MDNVQKASARLEKYLESKNPDYRTLTMEQAKDIFSMSTFDIWCAWTLLHGVLNGD